MNKDGSPRLLKDMNGNIISEKKPKRDSSKYASVYWRSVSGENCQLISAYPEHTLRSMMENLEEAWENHKAGRKVRYPEYLTGIAERMSAIRFYLQ